MDSLNVMKRSTDVNLQKNLELSVIFKYEMNTSIMKVIEAR